MRLFNTRIGWSVCAMAAAVFFTAAASWAQNGATQPQPTTPDGSDGLVAAENDLPKTLTALRQLLDEPGVVADPTKRAAALQKALPLFAQLDKDVAEARKWGPGMHWMIDMATTTADPIRAALGDPPFVAKLEAQAKSDNQKDASNAKALLARAEFLAAGKDPAAQDKALDTFLAAIKADPKSENLALYLAYSHNDKATAKSSADRIESIMKNDSQSRNAKMALDGWDAARLLASLPGKPLTITVPKLDGTPFSSDTLKGKVILVDFWATWCGPCIAELPHVTKIYQQYHDKGLEVISISCDEKADDIKPFLAEHKDITWTQLFDPKTPGWDAAKPFGIRAIPTMFLIDKKGILRTTEARKTMEETIPKLLAE